MVVTQKKGFDERAYSVCGKEITGFLSKKKRGTCRRDRSVKQNTKAKSTQKTHTVPAPHSHDTAPRVFLYVADSWSADTTSSKQNTHLLTTPLKCHAAYLSEVVTSELVVPEVNVAPPSQLQRFRPLSCRLVRNANTLDRVRAVEYMRTLYHVYSKQVKFMG